MAEDKKEYNNQEFIEQLRAINDENKISMDELNVLDMGNCPICYEKLQFLKYDEKEEKIKPNPNVVTTPCGHSFCFTCLSKHLENKNKCPICRKRLLKRPNLKPISVYEGCYVINQKIDEHLVTEIDRLIASSSALRDSSILLGSIKHCMYEMMQSFRRLQLVESDDETEL